MKIKQLQRIGRGAVINLDANQDDRGLIYANDSLIARGEIMVMEDSVSVSIIEIP